MLERILSQLSPAQKNALRAWYRGGKVQLVRRFRSYDSSALKRRLNAMGVGSGDTLLVHSAFGQMLGFQGSPNELIDTLLTTVAPAGNLLMVSMPYFSSTSDYLKKGEVFDVGRTASKMGLVSETFRRRPDVLRSLHPTHPVLACGPQAKAIVSGHERCPYPCGPGSPFEKILELNGKVLFFGVSEFHFTFHHYLEHMIKDELPFRLYEAEPYAAKVVDASGESRWVEIYAFTREAISRRRVHVLFDEMSRRGSMTRSRIGNTAMVLLDLADSVACTRDLARKGVYFYEMP